MRTSRHCLRVACYGKATCLLTLWGLVSGCVYPQCVVHYSLLKQLRLHDHAVPQPCLWYGPNTATSLSSGMLILICALLFMRAGPAPLLSRPRPEEDSHPARPIGGHLRGLQGTVFSLPCCQWQHTYISHCARTPVQVPVHAMHVGLTAAEACHGLPRCLSQTRPVQAVLLCFQ